MKQLIDIDITKQTRANVCVGVKWTSDDCLYILYILFFYWKTFDKPQTLYNQTKQKTEMKSHNVPNKTIENEPKHNYLENVFK